MFLREGKKYTLRKNFYTSMWFYGIFLITFVAIYLTPAARLVHHAVMTISFLLISASYLLSHVQEEKALYPLQFKFYKKIGIVWLVFFVLINLSLFITFTSQSIRPINDPSLKNINRVLSDEQLAKDYFYVAIDWGIYYYQGLYGPKEQSVLYIEPLKTEKQISTLQALADENGRKLLFVMMRDPNFVITLPEESSDRTMVQKKLGLVECKIIDKNSPWTIWLEPQEKEYKKGNICLP